MTALSAETTLHAERCKKDFRFRVGANVKIYKGAECAMKGSFLVPVTATTGLKHYCTALETVDNTGGAAGAKSCSVEFDKPKSLVRFINDTVAPVTVSDIGEHCYGVDDSAVVSASSDSGARSRVGTPWVIIATNDPIGQHPGVYVELDPSGLSSAVEQAPSMQAVDATLVAGTVTINTGITVAADSEVVPLAIGDITGSTNLAGLRELKSARVNGAPGVGSITVQAYTVTGVLDADAAGAIRVLIFAPQI